MALLDIFLRNKSCQLLAPSEGRLARKYESFKAFLDHNHQALNAIAELERMYHSGEPVSSDTTRAAFQRLMASTRALAASLREVADGGYAALSAACDRIEDQAVRALAPAPPVSEELVIDLPRLDPSLVSIAGSKATNLAVAGGVLGLPAPDGFVVTANAFRLFLDQGGLAGPIQAALADFDTDSPETMERVSRSIQAMIRSADIPPAVEEAVRDAYRRLEGRVGPSPRLAMRSSAVGEDSEASFAGQYMTALNVAEDDLLEAWRDVAASKYAPRAVAYRMRYGLDDADTPMCVAGVVMVGSAASGVLYTVDPSSREAGVMRVAAVLGLGEHLVSGEASPDVFLVDRDRLEIVGSEIARKEDRLVGDETAGTRLVENAEPDKDRPAVSPETVRELARFGQRLEEHFGEPQDVEWAVDETGRLFILQSRPLGLLDASPGEAVQLQGRRPLLAAGQTASPGCAVGEAFVAAEGRRARDMPDGAILVARTASPDYASLVGRMKGLVTDIGSAASHLASVAREFGVPTIVDAGDATRVLPHGEVVSLRASPPAVYAGAVPELAECGRPAKSHIFDSPAHRRLRELLDRVSPLHLTDPAAPSFCEDGCRTVHDVIRFAHEKAMREMFGLSEKAEGASGATRLVSNIPLVLYLIDLGGGLKTGLTTCDQVRPEHLESAPMQALWKGFTHPGITWSGTVAFDARSFMTLMASSAMAEVGGGTPGGDSYALVSRDYLNLSAKFGYHYSNIDAFCGQTPSHNYLFLRFSGGAGSYVGRSLRIGFMAQVLERLGCATDIRGDLLEAQLSGLDEESMRGVLDQIGRLFASSRLLDMAISDPAQVERMTEMFFAGEYDFLGSAETKGLPGFYAHTGNWSATEEEGRKIWLQDGSTWAPRVSTGLAGVMGRMVGAKYQEFLDNIEAYFYFPLAIAKDSEIGDGIIRCRVRPLAGKIDQAAGVAFGLKNVGNYFVLRINALEDNCILFEFVNNRRFQRAVFQTSVKSGEWRELEARIVGRKIIGALDGTPCLEYEAERPVRGHAGLWTKADSVCQFAGLEVAEA